MKLRFEQFRPMMPLGRGKGPYPGPCTDHHATPIKSNVIIGSSFIKRVCSGRMISKQCEYEHPARVGGGWGRKGSGSVPRELNARTPPIVQETVFCTKKRGERKRRSRETSTSGQFLICGDLTFRLVSPSWDCNILPPFALAFLLCLRKSARTAR